jgi:glycine dehydrogenase
LTNRPIAREQHIRREKATSNICTSQALLANMAAMYAVYHGPEGLKRIGNKVHGLTQLLKVIVERFGYRAIHQQFFDTLTLDVTGAVPSAQSLHSAAAKVGINLRAVDSKHVGVTLDESVGPIDFLRIVNAFSASVGAPISTAEGLPTPVPTSAIPKPLKRTSEYLPHPVYNKHHSETEMLRYIHHLQSKDLSLVHSMTPLGSCTMKLNSTSSMIPLTWPEFGAVHPFAPVEQVKGYSKIISVCFRHMN